MKSVSVLMTVNQGISFHQKGVVFMYGISESPEQTRLPEYI